MAGSVHSPSREMSNHSLELPNHGPAGKEGVKAGDSKSKRRDRASDSVEDLETFHVGDADIPEVDGDELAIFRAENCELRKQVATLEEKLRDALAKSEYWAEQYREYVGLLEEKSDVIRDLHLRIKEHQHHPAAPPAASRAEVGNDADVLALEDELQRERAQLKQDEQDLMKQMSELEVIMSRERADLARQRSDIERLHNEMRHELELATREAELRDRFQPFLRRQQELVRTGSAEPPKQPPNVRRRCRPARGTAGPGSKWYIPAPARRQRGPFRRRQARGPAGSAWSKRHLPAGGLEPACSVSLAANS